MSTGTLAVNDGRALGFGEHEPATGRRADVGILESGFWGNRSARGAVEPSLLEVPEELDALDAPEDLAGYEAPHREVPRKVAAASGVMRRVLELLEPLA